jgi:hypothetical protein
MMVDTLAKHDLLQYGAVTWLQSITWLENGNGERSSEEMQSQLESEIGRKFKYWTPKYMKLDVDTADEMSDDYIDWKKFYRGKMPIEYNHSFMHLITETYLHPGNFISEKTPIALLLMKPFLAIAAPKFHKRLEEIGFKLYDEIFDYSFDQHLDNETRCEGIAENIKKITKLSTTELKSLYDTLLPKLKHNRELAFKISTTIPNEIREIYDLYNNDPNFHVPLSWIVKNLDS